MVRFILFSILVLVNIIIHTTSCIIPKQTAWFHPSTTSSQMDDPYMQILNEEDAAEHTQEFDKPALINHTITTDCAFPHAYLEIPRFTTQTPNQIAIALEQSLAILKTPITIIIDIRNNGGGKVRAALETAALFSKASGPLAAKIYSSLPAHMSLYYAKPLTPNIIKKRVSLHAGMQIIRNQLVTASQLPPVCFMIIYINGKTASAAELFAQIMKEQLGASLIGTPTRGKGIAQSLQRCKQTIYLEQSLLYSTSMLISGKGYVWQQRGLLPTIYIPSVYREIAAIRPLPILPDYAADQQDDLMRKLYDTLTIA